MVNFTQIVLSVALALCPGAYFVGSVAIVPFVAASFLLGAEKFFAAKEADRLSAAKEDALSQDIDKLRAKLQEHEKKLSHLLNTTNFPGGMMPPMGPQP